MKTYKILALMAFYAVSAHALDSREMAFKLHNRLTGVPPKPAVLSQMESMIAQGNGIGAAKIAMQNPLFLNVVLKNWVKPWSNRDQTSRVDFNDYVATVLGVVRDDIGFDMVLYGDVLYTVAGVTPAYSPATNDHYKAAETGQVNLVTALQKVTQSSMNGIAATSGVVTTRASGEAFFSAGTNRRVNRFTFINYLCKDYEAIHDITVPDYHVRQDVERNPGGDSRTYKSKCVGCHAGQDALGGAYAYYDFPNGQLTYTAGSVAPKINKNVSFSDGWMTKDDSWINLWATGQNASLGWRGNTQGNGARAINQMISHSRAFSECMATKVYKLVCLKDVVTSSDKAMIQANASTFESGSEYNMKTLIAKTSAGCIVNE